MPDVIFVMLSGIIVGRILRKYNFRHLSSITTFFVWILLLLLGASVGANSKIINSIQTIGLNAFIIAFFSLLGSVVAARYIYKFFFNKGTNEG